MCVCFTRKFRVTEADPPEDVKAAFRKYSEGGAQMTAEQLRRFLAEVQLEEGGGGGVSVSDAEKVVELVLKTRHHLAKFTRNTLTLDDFHHYLFSADLNPPIKGQVWWVCFSFRFFCLVAEKMEENEGNLNWVVLGFFNLFFCCQLKNGVFP